MEPHYSDEAVTLYHGDCREVLAQLHDESVDSVVTDPPYELGFMGKRWDASGIAYDADLWAECLRVLKPGGHLLAFGGTRTWHRLAVAIEDAGFEIRDSIAWMYGSGFPKSLDVSKAIDRMDATAERTARARRFQSWMREHISPQRINEITGTDMGHHLTTHPTQPFVATPQMLDTLRPHLPPVPEWVEQIVTDRAVKSENFQRRKVVGAKQQPDATRVRLGFVGETYSGDGGGAVREVPITNAYTPDAARWQGWGTALKPAHEPIVVARKPLIGTVAANVLEHGTGALNIDGCRIASTDGYENQSDKPVSTNIGAGTYVNPDEQHVVDISGSKPTGGRWPANVVLDEDQAAALDRQSGTFKGRVGMRQTEGKVTFTVGQEINPKRFDAGIEDVGGASRFFYVAKAPAKERPKVDGIAHPTVKPLTLMRWLCRLVTPPGGVILEPFAGSGTTVQAAVAEGFRCIAIEREDDYLPLILSRLTPDDQEPDDGQLTLDASA